MPILLNGPKGFKVTECRSDEGGGYVCKKAVKIITKMISYKTLQTNQSHLSGYEEHGIIKRCKDYMVMLFSNLS